MEQENEGAAVMVTATGLGSKVDRHFTGTEHQLDVATGLIQLSHLLQSLQVRIAERHDLTPRPGQAPVCPG